MATYNNVHAIVTDIEGTTSSISFVKDVLFPYAANNMAEFINKNHSQPDVAQQLDDISKQENIPRDNLEQLVQQLLNWINNDIKATPLKTLQGMIWKKGYEQGDYQAHMYADATEYLQKWHQQNLPLYVYSSGSVLAQKLFFGYSQDGDLLPLFSGHFDTNIGHKQEQQAYDNIQKALNIPANHLLFLSDIEAELDAAKAAGYQTCHLVRDTTPSEHSAHEQVPSFAHIEIH